MERKITAHRLRELIWEEMPKKVYPDRVEMELPFFFGEEGNVPLRLIWRKDGSLSDDGTTLIALKNRLGDVSPYMAAVQHILKRTGDFRLVGGQKILLTAPWDPLREFNLMLRAISLIGALGREAD